MSAPTIYVPRDAFGQFKVKELADNDFALQSDFPTTLLSREMHVILFYDPDGIEPEILELWDEVARRVSGPVIAAVNMSSRREVMKAFLDVQTDFDNAFNAYTGFQSPTIRVCRKRQPQGVENGGVSIDALVGWISTLAWKPGYRDLDAYPNSDYQGPGPSAYFEGEEGDEQSQEEEEEEEINRDPLDEDEEVDSNGELLREEPRPIADPGFLGPPRPGFSRK